MRKKPNKKTQTTANIAKYDAPEEGCPTLHIFPRPTIPKRLGAKLVLRVSGEPEMVTLALRAHFPDAPTAKVHAHAHGWCWCHHRPLLRQQSGRPGSGVCPECAYAWEQSQLRKRRKLAAGVARGERVPDELADILDQLEESNGN